MCFGRIPLEEKRIFAGRKVWKPKGQKGFSYGRKKERKCAGGKGGNGSGSMCSPLTGRGKEKARGCEVCRNMGYSGRRGFEQYAEA